MIMKIIDFFFKNKITHCAEKTYSINLTCHYAYETKYFFQPHKIFATLPFINKLEVSPAVSGCIIIKVCSISYRQAEAFIMYMFGEVLDSDRKLIIEEIKENINAQ